MQIQPVLFGFSWLVNANELYCCIFLPSMSLKRAVSMSLGSLSDNVGSRLSNEASSNDRLFIFTVVPGYPLKSQTSHVPTFAKKKKASAPKVYPETRAK